MVPMARPMSCSEWSGVGWGATWPDSGQAGGRRFESCRARHPPPIHSRNRPLGLPSYSFGARQTPSISAWQAAWQAVRVAERVTSLCGFVRPHRACRSHDGPQTDDVQRTLAYERTRVRHASVISLPFFPRAQLSHRSTSSRYDERSTRRSARRPSLTTTPGSRRSNDSGHASILQIPASRIPSCAAVLSAASSSPTSSASDQT